MLFTVNKSPFTAGNLKSCLRYAVKETPILLYEDAVYGAMAGTALEPMMKDALKKHDIYALKEDLSARGVDKTIDGIQVVDYAGFVDLVEKLNVCPWI
jgi:tRNA 2-thiouridine synthesizing protein B